ncbi:MAG: hypothetical protein ACO1QB_03290 [Verrucomicrobiales bacterium]
MKNPAINLNEKVGKSVGKPPEGKFYYDRMVDATAPLSKRGL